jgi:hypothetical protein
MCDERFRLGLEDEVLIGVPSNSKRSTVKSASGGDMPGKYIFKC